MGSETRTRFRARNRRAVPEGRVKKLTRDRARYRENHDNVSPSREEKTNLVSRIVLFRQYAAGNLLGLFSIPFFGILFRHFFTDVYCRNPVCTRTDVSFVSHLKPYSPLSCPSLAASQTHAQRYDGVSAHRLTPPRQLPRADETRGGPSAADRKRPHLARNLKVRKRKFLTLTTPLHCLDVDLLARGGGGSFAAFYFLPFFFRRVARVFNISRTITIRAHESRFPYSRFCLRARIIQSRSEYDIIRS